MDIYFEGIRNRAWRLTDPKAIRDIKKRISGKDVFIADGHHRYEVSRMYSAELSNAVSAKSAPEGLKKRRELLWCTL